LACSGIAPNAKQDDWIALANENDRIQRGMTRLHALFKDAPVLGSLIDPLAAEGNLIEADFHELQPFLEKALAHETKDDTTLEMAVTARGLAKAAEILAGHFTLVVTNVPYLGRGKQEKVLADYCDRVHPDAKADLATCFVDRCLQLCTPGGSSMLVTPQNWLFLGTYKTLRQRLLKEVQWDAVSRLGEHAFESSQAAGAFVALLGFTSAKPGNGHAFFGLDATEQSRPGTKAYELREGEIRLVEQNLQLENPDARILLEGGVAGPRLSDFAYSFLGLGTGDFPHYGRCFWEFPAALHGWTFQQASVYQTLDYGGRELVVAWDSTIDRVRGMDLAERQQIHNQDQSGQQAWGKKGVAVALMRELKVTLYSGEKYEKALTVLVPKKPEHLPAIWACCTSADFNERVRKLDQKVIVANATVAKIPFDLSHWQKVAKEKYPNGLPSPFSSDPTQWLFDGHPKDSSQTLQVAVARLLGYCWPRQAGSSFPDCPAIKADSLSAFADDDGVVCLSSVSGEPPGDEQLRELLRTSWGKTWNSTVLEDLLARVGYAGKTLDDWLRDGFFEQHCALFQSRPFIWHVWDGRRDGFNALVNYHRLSASDGGGQRTLDKLIYTYLGAWIERQQLDQENEIDGAEGRLAAAQHLKAELERIRMGDSPFDIFVRWKALSDQPVGWDPDINDGVRLNIRPFMTARPLGARAKNACILRTTPRISWDKDRGRDPERSRSEFPWLWKWDGSTADFLGSGKFDGVRWNNLHYSLSAKRAATKKDAA
jgi:N-6 DNA Methylase